NPAADFALNLARSVLFNNAKLDKLLERFIIKSLNYYEEYQIGDYKAETVKGRHKTTVEGEASINYLLTSNDGVRLLYALDTGYYDDETWEYLQGRHTDILVMDSTFGGRTDRGEFPFGHLDCYSFVRQLEKMAAIGFIDSDTQVFATHFNPHTGFSHQQVQDFYDNSPFEVTTGYDGLIARA
ncbi:MAG: hypothetical protein HN368_08505, partial [Spirochaetales bacterium]|nr:hypothetical protein [Spirochaetales bacterium]